MPKYYIKIKNDKFIISSQNITIAIRRILYDNQDKYTKGLTVYISETGFEGNNWKCYKIDKYLE